MTLAFLACVEPGNLENQGLLLFRSIRRFGGRFADAPIYSFQPRSGGPLRAETLRTMDELGVCHRTEVLNGRFPDYPISNKVFVSSWAEAHLDEDVLVFCDSDTIFVGEPQALELDQGVAVRPVDHRNRGSKGPGSREDPYWRRLYEICGITAEPYVSTAIEGERIRAFWNAGLVAARRTTGLFHAWERDFLQLMDAGHLPGGQITFMDQLALAATLAREPGLVRQLDARYNYALPKRSVMRAPERDYQLEDLIHVHYHRWFNKPGFLGSLRPPLERDPIYGWLERFLPFEPLIETPTRY